MLFRQQTFIKEFYKIKACMFELHIFDCIMEKPKQEAMFSVALV